MSNQHRYYEEQPSYQQDTNPSFELFNTKFSLPPQTATVLILLMFLERVAAIFKSKPVEFTVDLLRGADLDLLERLDDIAVELKELTKADRVLIAGFHNGKKNNTYHWKRLSVLAESTRIGIEPVIQKLKDIDTVSILTLSDYNNLFELKANKTFIHTHLDLPTLSAKQKRFLGTCYMFGQYVMLLVDENAEAPHGIIFIQYDSREKCEIQTENYVGWSDSTRTQAFDKAVVVNNLIYERGTSRIQRIIGWVKKKCRIF